MSQKTFTNLTTVTLVLAFVVIVLGAYVRLSDAGLGCPDWPGCYGKIIVPEEALDTAGLFPERPLEHGKAWKEMIHRYAAGTLGILIFLITFLSWKYRKISDQSVMVPSALLVLVIFQALLGMWTVTLLLKPVIVMAHLLGGMTILCLLMWYMLEQVKNRNNIDLNNVRFFPWAMAGLIMAIIQISLGGWTSANYAALVCPDFPTCQNSWWPSMDFINGFKLWHELGIDYEGGILAGDARTAIHMTHRIGAMLTLLVIGSVSTRAIIDRNKSISTLGILLLVVLLIQLGLGISNVLMRLPLPIAVAHNAVAALLLLVLVALLHQTKRPGINRRLV